MRGAEKLFDAITEVREDLVEEALDHRFQAKKAIPWQRYAKWAACLALVVCIGYLAANLDLRMGGMNSAAGNSGSNSAAGETTGDTADDAGDSDLTTGAGAPEDSDGSAAPGDSSGSESGTVGGSVVPALSLAEEDSSITAVRTLALEFYQDGTAIATDYYTLTNSGEAAVTVTLCYEGTGVRACLLDGEEISSGTALTLESGETAEVVLDSAVTPEDNTLTLATPGNLEVPEATLHLINQPDGLTIHELRDFEQVEVS